MVAGQCHLVRDCQTELVEVGAGINKLKHGFDKLNLTDHFLNERKMGCAA